MNARLQAFDAKVQKLLDDDPPPPVASVSWDLRRKVALRIAQLNEHNAAHVVQVLEHLQPRAIRSSSRPDSDTVLDINNLSKETLDKLQVSCASFSSHGLPRDHQSLHCARPQSQCRASTVCR